MENKEIKQYEQYKNSGIPWIGEIPEHWEVYKIKNIVDRTKYYQIGDGDHGSIKPHMYRTSGIPYIRVQNLSYEGRITEDGLVYISEEVHNTNLKSKIMPEDILIAKTGATIGKLGLVPTSIKEANTTSSVGKVTVDKKRFYPKFVLYSFMSKYFLFQIWQDAMQKSAQPGFNIDDLIEYKIIAPSLYEQSLIARYLDRKTAEIDELIAKKERLLDLYEEEKKAIINKTVTKGINPNVKMKDSGIPWLGEIPEHWEVKRLKYLGNVIIGVTYKPDDVVKDTSQGTLVLRASNIQNGKLDLSDCVYISMNILEYLRLRPGDILICSRSGSRDLIGKNILIDNEMSGNTFGTFMTVFRPIKQNYKFIYYFFNSQVFDSQSSLYSTVTINQLTIAILKNITIVLPPLSEQKKIVNFLDNQLSLIDSKIEKTKKVIELLKEYKISLISEVVTGKRKVI